MVVFNFEPYSQLFIYRLFATKKEKEEKSCLTQERMKIIK